MHYKLKVFTLLVLADGFLYNAVVSKKIPRGSRKKPFESLKIFPLVVQSGTVYTNNANGSKDQTSDGAVAMLYQGTSKGSLDNIVGKTLGDIIDGYLKAGKLLEAHTLVKNVYESIGITGMYRFCDIIVQQPRLLGILFLQDLKHFNSFLDSVKSVFSVHSIPLKPIKDLAKSTVFPTFTVDTLEVYNNLKDDCPGFLRDYKHLVNLVRVYDWKDFDDSSKIEDYSDELNNFIETSLNYLPVRQSP